MEDIKKRWIIIDEAAKYYEMSLDEIKNIATDINAMRGNYLINKQKMDSYVDRLCTNTKKHPEYEHLFKALKYNDEFCNGYLSQLKEFLASGLTGEEQKVISNLYGIDCKKISGVCLANNMGCSNSQIYKIRDRAIRKIRHELIRWDKMNKFLALDMEISTKELFQILKVDDLSLSTRSINVLLRSGMATNAYDLLNLDVKELHKVRGCGTTSIAEIQQFQKCLKYLVENMLGGQYKKAKELTTKENIVWDPEWYCQKDPRWSKLNKDGVSEEELEELYENDPPPLIFMIAQKEIDKSETLSNAQGTYKKQVLRAKIGEDRKGWSNNIECQYGTSSAWGLSYGLALLHEYTVAELAKVTKKETGYNTNILYDEFFSGFLQNYLPEQYTGKYNSGFFKKLLKRIDFFLDNPDKMCVAHKPIDEIIIYMATRIVDDNFEGLFDETFEELAFTIFGDCDVEMILYENTNISKNMARSMGTNLDDYSFEEWFNDKFYTGESNEEKIEKLSDALQKEAAWEETKRNTIFECKSKEDALDVLYDIFKGGTFQNPELVFFYSPDADKKSLIISRENGISRGKMHNMIEIGKFVMCSTAEHGNASPGLIWSSLPDSKENELMVLAWGDHSQVEDTLIKKLNIILKTKEIKQN